MNTQDFWINPNKLTDSKYNSRAGKLTEVIRIATKPGDKKLYFKVENSILRISIYHGIAFSKIEFPIPEEAVIRVAAMTGWIIPTIDTSEEF